MVIPHHTHHFELPVASGMDMAAGIATDKIVVPANLGSACLEAASAFATAAQGIKADSAVQPSELGLLAYKNKIEVSDIDGGGGGDETRFLRGDGLWAVPPVSSGSDSSDGSDNSPCWTNFIINGNFIIDQRRGLGNVMVGQWACDRWLNVEGGRRQIVENLVTGDYALFWEGGGIGRIGGLSGASGLVTNLGTGNVSIIVPVGAHNVALIRCQGDVPASNPYRSRLFAQELQLCQRYYQKSTAYEIAADSGNGLYGALVAATPGLARSLAQGCVTFTQSMARAPTMSYYGNGDDANNVYVINSSGQVTNLAVETVFINENYCIFANATNLGARAFFYKLHYAADAEITM